MPKSPSSAQVAAQSTQSGTPAAELDDTVNSVNSVNPTAKSFEAALAELEKLVGKMESGSLSLEQSLAAHARGLELAKFCQSLLARAEQQVKVLEDDMLKAFPLGRTNADDDE